MRDCGFFQYWPTQVTFLACKTGQITGITSKEVWTVIVHHDTVKSNKFSCFKLGHIYGSFLLPMPEWLCPLAKKLIAIKGFHEFFVAFKTNWHSLTSDMFKIEFKFGNNVIKVKWIFMRWLYNDCSLAYATSFFYC